MKLPLAILRGAAMLVPAPRRAEWLAEWQSELWYVEGRPAVFCLGAFQDALWVRHNHRDPPVHRIRLASPVHCLLFLSVLAGVSLFLAFRLAGARAALLPPPYRDADRLAMISAKGRYSRDTPTIRLEQFLSLSDHLPGRYAGVAYYRPERTRVETAEMNVAFASGNLFDLLRIPIAGDSNSQARLVLSRAAWRKHFGSTAVVAGRSVEVGGRQAVIAAVITDIWGLPGRVDAWLLLGDRQLAHLPPRTAGFVLGSLRTRPSGVRNWGLSAPNAEGSYDRFECASLAKENFLLACVLTLLLALLVLSTTTTLSLGEYPANRETRLRRWIFLAIKMALLLTIVGFGALDLASLVSEGLAAHAFIWGTILALRWALADQRRRCPECLRLLSHPTRIGGPSHIFLEWYGTELICIAGHGLLYVPEIPTSCYSAPRWQYLDASWR